MKGTELISLGRYPQAVCDVDITARPKDGYVNATAMCKAYDRLWADFARLDATQQYLKALSLTMGIPIDRLVWSKPGRPSRSGGTWVHPDLATELARWLAPMFGVWINQRIRELLTTGQVVLHREHTEAALVERLAPEVARQLLTISEEHEGQNHLLRYVAKKAKRGERLQKEIHARVVGQRKDFARATYDAYAKVVLDRFKGTCPVTKERIVDSDGRRLPLFRLHHWRGKGGNDPRSAFPCSIAGHEKLGNSQKEHDHFESYKVVITDAYHDLQAEMAERMRKRPANLGPKKARRSQAPRKYKSGPEQRYLL